jgi:hypothetical protein
MQDGRLVETGPARLVLSAPGQAYTQRLMAAVPGAATRGHWLVTTGDAPKRKTVTSDQPPLLEADDVSVRFKRPDGNTLDALAGVSLSFGRERRLASSANPARARPRLGRWRWRCSLRIAARFVSGDRRGAGSRNQQDVPCVRGSRPSCRIRSARSIRATPWSASSRSRCACAAISTGKRAVTGLWS